MLLRARAAKGQDYEVSLEALARNPQAAREPSLAEAAWISFRGRHREKTASEALLLALREFGLVPLIASPSVQRFFIEVQRNSPETYRSALAALKKNLPALNAATKAELDNAATLYQRYMIVLRDVRRSLKQARTHYTKPSSLGGQQLEGLSANAILLIELDREVQALADGKPVDGADTAKRIAARFVCQSHSKKRLDPRNAERQIEAARKLLEKRNPELLRFLRKLDTALANPRQPAGQAHR